MWFQARSLDVIPIPDLNLATEPGPDPSSPVFCSPGLGETTSATSGIGLGWVWMSLDQVPTGQITWIQAWWDVCGLVW